jgi:hypothetical protein
LLRTGVLSLAHAGAPFHDNYLWNWRDFDRPSGTGHLSSLSRHFVHGLKFGHFPKAWMWAESDLPNGPPVLRATFLELGFRFSLIVFAH